MRWKVWSYWRSMKWRCFGNRIDSDITRLGKRLKFSVFLNWDWLGEKVLWRQINFRRSTCIWRQCFKKVLANLANLANLNASTMLALIKILQKIALNLIYEHFQALMIVDTPLNLHWGEQIQRFYQFLFPFDIIRDLSENLIWSQISSFPISHKVQIILEARLFLIVISLLNVCW